MANEENEKIIANRDNMHNREVEFSNSTILEERYSDVWRVTWVE